MNLTDTLSLPKNFVIKHNDTNSNKWRDFVSRCNRRSRKRREGTDPTGYYGIVDNVFEHYSLEGIPPDKITLISLDDFFEYLTKE